MDIIIRDGGKMVSDVYGKNRNQLMKLIVEECSNPMGIIQSGVKSIQKRLKNASMKREPKSSSRLALLKRVAEKGDAAGIVRILALDNKKKKKTIRGPPPPIGKIQKNSGTKPKPTSRPKPKPARKPAKPARKPARRCATSW